MMDIGEMPDMTIVKLRRMYFEEKINSTPEYIMLENKICRMVEQSFLCGKFTLLLPEIFSEIMEQANSGEAETALQPFSVLRTPFGSMALALYEIGIPSGGKVDISERFSTLFSKDVIDESRVIQAADGDVTWMDFRKTSNIPCYHSIFSFFVDSEMIIGDMSSYLSEYERCRNLMTRVLAGIKFKETGRSGNERTFD